MAHCVECKVSFSEISNLRAHVRITHPEKIDILAPKIKGRHRSLICKECKATFVQMRNLRKHIQQKHAEKFQDLVPVKKKFNCKQCNSEFDMLNKLIMHRKSQRRVPTLICEECKATFVKPISRLQIVSLPQHTTHWRLENT